jgi:hypothetical protein
MESGKNKIEWQELAQARLEDAEILLKNKRFAAAYYLAGIVSNAHSRRELRVLCEKATSLPSPNMYGTPCTGTI